MRRSSVDTPPVSPSLVADGPSPVFQNGGTTGVRNMAREIRSKAPQFETAFCSCSFILGLLLIFVSKKLMKTILAFFGGLASSLVAFKIIEKFEKQIPVFQNGWIILAVCVVVALVAVIILRGVVKQAFKLVIALSLGCIAYFVDPQVQGFFNQHWFLQAVMPWVVGFIAVSVGYFFGAKFTMPTFKFIGAGLGAFFIVTSVAYFMQGQGWISSTSFNLVTIVKGLHYYRSSFHAGGDAGAAECEGGECGDVPVDAEGGLAIPSHCSEVDNVMWFAFLAIFFISAFYQLVLQTSSKGRERIQTGSMPNARETKPVEV